MDRMKKQKQLLPGIIFAGTFLFVLLGEGNVSYVMGGDTEAYYLNFHHHIGVAPGYPLFIHVIELIFGSRLYLHIVAFLQMLLLAFSVMYLVNTLRKLFTLKVWETLAVWFFSMLPFVMLLPEDPIGHTLMTESLTYPLFYIFMAFVLKGILKEMDRCFAAGLLLAMLMAWIRPQMQFTFAVIGIAFFYTEIKKRKRDGKNGGLWNAWYTRTALCLMIILLGMQGVSGVTVLHERIFFDAPALDFSDQTLVQRLLYVAGEEDAELFEEMEVREIYEKTWEKMQEMQTTQQYYDQDWKSWSGIIAAFGANSRILKDVIREKLAEQGKLAKDAVGQEEQVAEISHEIMLKLMKAYWREHLQLTGQLLPKSFISTVFFHKKTFYSLIWAATCLVYFLALAGSLFLYIRKREIRAAEWMLLVIGTSTVNAVACDLILCGLQRYMCYTLGMMWIGIFLLGRKILDVFLRRSML